MNSCSYVSLSRRNVTKTRPSEAGTFFESKQSAADGHSAKPIARATSFDCDAAAKFAATSGSAIAAVEALDPDGPVLWSSCSSPIRTTARLSVGAARGRVSTAELNLLLANANKGSVVHGLTGEHRMYLYMVASGTGYRAHELSTVTPAACHLDDEPPYIEVARTISKRRRVERQPIHPELATRLRQFIGGKPADQPLWPGGWWRKACKIMKENDLTGIVAETPEGRLEFHSLRHTYVTSVVATGANQELAMEVCRLSDAKLLSRYNHTTDADRLRVIGALPVPRLPKAVGRQGDRQPI